MRCFEVTLKSGSPYFLTAFGRDGALGTIAEV